MYGGETLAVGRTGAQPQYEPVGLNTNRKLNLDYITLVSFARPSLARS